MKFEYPTFTTAQLQDELDFQRSNADELRVKAFTAYDAGDKESMANYMEIYEEAAYVADETEAHIMDRQFDTQRQYKAALLGHVVMESTRCQYKTPYQDQRYRANEPELLKNEHELINVIDLLKYKLFTSEELNNLGPLKISIQPYLPLSIEKPKNKDDRLILESNETPEKSITPFLEQAKKEQELLNYSNDNPLADKS